MQCFTTKIEFDTFCGALKTESIGEGSFGMVRASSASSIAKKRMRYDPDGYNIWARWRELCAAQLLARLPHPNIVAFKALCLRSFCFAMERHQTDLSTYLRSAFAGERQLSPRLRFSLLQQLVRAVCFCHELRLVHGDIKPSNILISQSTQQNDMPRLALADFGTCTRLTTNCLPQSTRPLSSGTFTLRAIEAHLEPRRVLAVSDMWSVGVIALNLACCDHAFIEWHDYQSEAENIARILLHYGWFDDNLRAALQRFCAGDDGDVYINASGKNLCDADTRLNDWFRPICANWASFADKEHILVRKADCSWRARWKHCDADQREQELVSGMLRIDPFARITARQALFVIDGAIQLHCIKQSVASSASCRVVDASERGSKCVISTGDYFCLSHLIFELCAAHNICCTIGLFSVHVMLAFFERSTLTSFDADERQLVARAALRVAAEVFEHTQATRDVVCGNFSHDELGAAENAIMRVLRCDLFAIAPAIFWTDWTHSDAQPPLSTTQYAVDVLGLSPQQICDCINRCSPSSAFFAAKGVSAPLLMPMASDLCVEPALDAFFDCICGAFNLFASQTALGRAKTAYTRFMLVAHHFPLVVSKFGDAELARVTAAAACGQRLNAAATAAADFDQEFVQPEKRRR